MCELTRPCGSRWMGKVTWDVPGPCSSCVAERDLAISLLTSADDTGVSHPSLAVPAQSGTRRRPTAFIVPFLSPLRNRHGGT